VYKVTHCAKTYTASTSHKEGMLNWWLTLKPVSVSQCPVRYYSAPVVPQQAEISGAATAERMRVVWILIHSRFLCVYFSKNSKGVCSVN